MCPLFRGRCKSYKDEETVKFLNSAGDFGLKNGIASGVHDPELKRTSLFSFVSNRPRFSQHHKKVMDIVTPHLHNALAGICELERPVNIPDVIGGSQIIRYI
ncbi:MAG: autoinducer binding domain-containing protein [Deltaproteobacteria bacterium]|nr:autoinducer binding domain-containing protein [Deltaproteobacteria bacterium]